MRHLKDTGERENEISLMNEEIRSLIMSFRNLPAKFLTPRRAGASNLVSFNM